MVEINIYYKKTVALLGEHIKPSLTIRVKNHPVYTIIQLARLNVVIKKHVQQLNNSENPYYTFSNIPDRYKYNPAILALAIDKLAPRSIHSILHLVPDQSFISEKDFLYMIQKCSVPSMYLLANAIGDGFYTSNIAKQLVLSSGDRISEVYENIPERFRDSDLGKMAIRSSSRQKDREYIYTLTPPDQRDESLKDCYFSYLNSD